MTWFNLAEIEHLRSKPKPLSWRALGKLYHRHHETVRNKYNREKAARNLLLEERRLKPMRPQKKRLYRLNRFTIRK